MRVFVVPSFKDSYDMILYVCFKPAINILYHFRKVSEFDPRVGENFLFGLTLVIDSAAYYPQTIHLSLT